MIKKIKILFILLFSITSAYSQFDLSLLDLHNNPVIHNPAYVGVSESYYFKSTYSTQWVGFEGAPKTQTLDIQYHFDDERHAFGISMINDEFGATKNSNIEANYAFHLNFNYETRMALGLKVGINNFQINYNLLNIYQPEEYVYQQSNITSNLPLVGIGFYVYQNNWFLAVSAPNLIRKNIEERSIFRDYLRKRPHAYVNFGYNFRLNNKFVLKTHVLSQLVSGAPLGILINTNVEYDEKFMFGLHVDPSSLIGASTSIEIFNNVRFSYAYNFSLNELASYSNGNHNFGISFDLERRFWSNRRYFLEQKPYKIR